MNFKASDPQIHTVKTQAPGSLPTPVDYLESKQTPTDRPAHGVHPNQDLPSDPYSAQPSSSSISLTKSRRTDGSTPIKVYNHLCYSHNDHQQKINKLLLEAMKRAKRQLSTAAGGRAE